MISKYCTDLAAMQKSQKLALPIPYSASSVWYMA